MSKFDVVISGMSGRFPECDDVDTFKEKLYNMENFITHNDKKWPLNYRHKFGETVIPSGTGKYTNVANYDPMAFRMNSVFARSNDILNRKVLEPSFEAIIDAGINPYSLDGRNIGVYMSCGVNEMDKAACVDDRKVLLVIGSSKTMLSNRISFALNFTGPSFTYYTDILGGVEALSTGYKNVAEGYVDAAVVGVSSSIINVHLSLQYLSLDLLSPDGLCRVLDKNAAGFGRSESTVILFLQRAEDAKRCYGRIRLCDNIYNGLNPFTLLKYDEDYIKDLFKCMYNRNHVDFHPSDLSFLEMSAYGDQKSDKIESNVVSHIFGKIKNDPLLVGSVKSNIGHTEGSSAFTSLLKALLALETNVIAPNLHYTTVNNEIEAFNQNKLKVITQPTTLPGNLIGINTVGIVGSVGHVVLQQNSITNTAESTDANNNSLPRLLLICGRTENGLHAAIEKIEKLPFNRDFISLTNDAFGTHMPLHLFRGYTILPKPFKALNETQVRGDKNRPIWFLFSGMGSQWNTMGKGLLDLPIFANVVERCNKVLKPEGIDVYKILTSEDTAMFDNIVHSFVGIITVQLGLTEILKALKIEPDGIIGHSVGENACAYADGCLSLEQAVLASYARGMASTEVETIKGMMAAVGKGFNDLKTALPGNIEIACHNSDNSCTLSGPAEEVEKFVGELKKAGIFAKAVNVANIAYHSKYIAPAGPKLLSRLREVIPEPIKRSSKWISTSISESNWDTPLAEHCSAEYLTNNLLNPVLFEEGCKHIPKNALIIEIAPHGLLQAIVKKSLPECINIPLTHRNKTQENLTFLLSAIGKLYIAGCEPEVNELFPKISYPVPRGTPTISSYATWDHTTINIYSKYLQSEKPPPLSGELIEVQINQDSQYSYLRNHKINDQISIPPSFFIYLTWWMLCLMKQEKFGTNTVLFEEIKLHKTVTISIKKPRSFSIMIQGSNNFELVLEDTNKDKVVIIMTGKISTVIDKPDTNVNNDSLKETKWKISSTEFYEKFRSIGYQLEDPFLPVEELSYNESDVFGKITWNQDWVIFLDSLLKFQMYLRTQRKSDLIYPYYIRRLLIEGTNPGFASKGTTIICHQNHAEKILRCNGLEMKGLKYKILSSKSSKTRKANIKLERLQFVPYENPRSKTIQEFLYVCLQIAVEKALTIGNAEDKLYVIESPGKQTKILEKIVKENNFLKSTVKFTSRKELLSPKLKFKEKCVLMVTNDANELIECKFEHVFVVATFSSNKSSNNNFTESFVIISKQTFQDSVIHFLKKKRVSNGKSTPILIDSKNWLPMISKETKSIISVQEHKETFDLSLILDKKRMSKERLLIPLNTETESFKFDTISLKRQISAELPISVLHNGKWGSYRNVSIDYEERHINNERKLKELRSTNISLQSIDVSYFNPNIEYEELEDNEKCNCGIEYSGTHISGKRIMGLANVNSESESKADSTLMWDVPKNWTLEDASTVPFIYTQAYYIMYIKKPVDYIRSAFINMGNENLLTEALISLMLQENYSVYVSVSNKDEAKMIRTKFPQLEDFRIIINDRCVDEFDLLAKTNNEGADFVINCRSGFEQVKCALKCVKEFGCYMEVGENNCKDFYTLGLSCFLNAINIVSTSNKISSLIGLPEYKKKQLQLLVENGIKTGTVKPFSRVLKNEDTLDEISSPQKCNVKQIMKNYTNGEKIPTLNRRLQYDQNHSYVIVGDSRKDNSWYELVQYLSNKGARKFIIALNTFTFSPKISSQMNRLLNQKNVTIALTSSQKLETLEGATKIINEAYTLAPLEAIFFISVLSSNKIHNMNAASLDIAPKVPFICLFSNGLRECERRQCKGFPAIMIHGEKTSGKISTILSHVEDILSQSHSENSSAIYRIVNESCELESQSTTLADFLPQSMESLERIGLSMTVNPEFKEMTSLSLPYSETRGIYPVFVLPAVHGTQLQPLIRKLVYPVFSATLSECNNSVANLASHLYKALIDIQTTGPVTVICEAWSAGIAIEMTSLFEHFGRKYKIFLIEGDPIEWRDRIQNLGPLTSPQFDNNFIKKIFSFSDINLESLVKTEDSFQANVEKHLSGYSSNDVDVNLVIKAVKAIRERILLATRYELPEKILGNLTLFQRNDSENFSLKFSVTSEIVIVEEDNYRNFIQNARICATINKESLYTWWDYSKPQTVIQ